MKSAAVTLIHWAAAAAMAPDAAPAEAPNSRMQETGMVASSIVPALIEQAMT
jgi:hypothetical protein